MAKKYKTIKMKVLLTPRELDERKSALEEKRRLRKEKSERDRIYYEKRFRDIDAKVKAGEFVSEWCTCDQHICRYCKDYYDKKK